MTVVHIVKLVHSDRRSQLWACTECKYVLRVSTKGDDVSLEVLDHGDDNADHRAQAPRFHGGADTAETSTRE